MTDQQRRVRVQGEWWLCNPESPEPLGGLTVGAGPPELALEPVDHIIFSCWMETDPGRRVSFSVSVSNASDATDGDLRDGIAEEVRG